MSEKASEGLLVAFRIVHGYVRQDFLVSPMTEGKCVGQQFVAGDPVDWEDEVGNPVDVPEHKYQPFNMVHPAIEAALAEWGVLNDDLPDAEFAAKVEAFKEKLNA